MDREEVQGPSVWASKTHRPVCSPYLSSRALNSSEGRRDPQRKHVEKTGVLSGALRGAGWLQPNQRLNGTQVSRAMHLLEECMAQRAPALDWEGKQHS